jgi:hypothetical protein
MINKIIRSFQVKHDNATSQLHKDLLLIRTVALCIAIRLGQAMLAFILFIPVMLYIGLLECIKQLWLGLIAWPIAIWDCLKHIPGYAKALRHLGQDTLPVNRKPLPLKR